MSDDLPSNEIVDPVLQEFALQHDFLDLIPQKAQKGLSTFDLEFTCVDADVHYIALGSNVGIVYLYDRKKQYLSRLRNNHKDSITSVKVLISLECLILCGSKNGYVSLFKVPFEEKEKTEKLPFDCLHTASVQSLAWNLNGPKFFSGDDNGIVVCTEVDFLKHQSKSRVLLKEQGKIVQLSCNRYFLVVSTVYRAVIYSFDTQTSTKVGKKERKCFGPFGAVITQLLDSSDEVIFASRPGQRLWKSNMSGTIQETMIFKSAISEPHPIIPLNNKDENLKTLTDFQFGLIKPFLDKFLVIYSDYSLIIIDPSKMSIIGSCPKLDPIIDICTANDEIFVLRGLRNLIRVSLYPDPYPCNAVPVEPSLFEELLTPLIEFGTLVKERSDSLAIQSENVNLFDWLKKKRSASTPPALVDDVPITKEVNSSEPLPQVIKLESNELTPVALDERSNQFTFPEIIIPTDEVDDIVYKPKKKKKNKKVRFRSLSPKSDRQSLKPSSKENSEKIKNAYVDKSLDLSSNCDYLREQGSILNKNNQVPLKINLSDKTIFNETDVSNRSVTSSDVSVLDNFKDTVDVSNNSIIDQNENTSQNSSSALSINEDVKNQNITKDQDSKQNDPDDIYASIKIIDPVNSETESTHKEIPDSLTSEESSILRDDSSESEPPKYGVEWVEYKAPDLLLDLSISHYHIYCVDVKNHLYVSHFPILGMHWTELSQPAEKISVSPNDTIIWVLYKGSVYAAEQKSTIKWEEAEWIRFAGDVISIAVEDNCGWYVTSSGVLVKHSNLSADKLYCYPENVPCKINLSQVTCQNNILWALSDGGTLHCWSYKSEKEKWKEIKFEDDEIDSIYLGLYQTGWVINCYGTIKFIIGVTPDSPEGVGKPWEVETSKYLLQNTSQLKNSMLKALNNEAISNLVKGVQHISLSTSSQGIWFCKSYNNIVYGNQKGIIGHLWDSIVPPGTSVSTRWSTLVASGLSSIQDSLWCVNANGEIFCFLISTNTLVTVESPNISDIKCLVPSCQSLWLLSEDGHIYIRRGITSNCLQGVWWQNLNLNQLGSEKIIHVSCSPESTWACSSEGQIFVRFGTLCPSSDRKLPQAWIPLSMDVEVDVSPIVDSLSSIGKKFPIGLIHHTTPDISFTKVYVGPLGYPVWALDSKKTVFVREGVTNNFPIGKKWTCVPELKAQDLCISKNGVWLLKNSGKIFRRFGMSEKNPCGDYWKQMPGIMNYISVTEDDDLWGLKNNFMYRHSSFHWNFMPNNESKKLPSRSISEDDWEDIMAEESDE